MEWFKFYGGAYLSDPKMLMLTACERSCWLTLLSYASVSEDGGRIKYLTEQQLMIAANVSPMHEEWDATLGVLKKFEDLGMIDNSNGIITVKNWSKRQESYLTNAERQRRYREKQKSNAEVTPVSNDSNARIEENRIDISGAEAPQTIIEVKVNEEGEDASSSGRISGKKREAYESMLKWAENERGFNFVNRVKQYKALAKAKSNGIKSGSLKERWLELVDDPYFSEKGFDWTNVVNSFDRKGV